MQNDKTDNAHPYNSVNPNSGPSREEEEERKYSEANSSLSKK